MRKAFALLDFQKFLILNGTMAWNLVRAGVRQLRTPRWRGVLLAALVVSLLPGCAAPAPAPSPRADPALTGLGPPASLPLDRSEVTVLVEENAGNLPRALFRAPDGSVELVFVRVPPDASRFDLFAISWVSGRGWSEPTHLVRGPEPYQGGASVVSLPEGHYLYYVKSESLRKPGVFVRRRLLETGLGPVEEISGAPSLSLLSFPRLHPLHEKRVALVFRDGESRGQIAFSEDGLLFAPAAVVVSEPVAAVDLGVFADGALAFVYQTARPEGIGKISWVQLSSDGVAWSSPIQIAPEMLNVHDPYPFLRQDGDLDLYFSSTNEGLAGGFSLFRRRLAVTGELGAVERVSTRATGSLLYPRSLRLPTGAVLSVASDVSGRMGEVGHLVVFLLPGDSEALHRILLDEEEKRGTASRGGPREDYSLAKIS